jgi:hypothetical protein
MNRPSKAQCLFRQQENPHLLRSPRIHVHVQKFTDIGQELSFQIPTHHSSQNAQNIGY